MENARHLADGVVAIVRSGEENVAVHLQNIVSGAGVESVERGEQLLSAGGAGVFGFRAEPLSVGIAHDSRVFGNINRPIHDAVR